METFALAAVKQWQTSCGLNEAEMEAFILFFLKNHTKNSFILYEQIAVYILTLLFMLWFHDHLDLLIV